MKTDEIQTSYVQGYYSQTHLDHLFTHQNFYKLLSEKQMKKLKYFFANLFYFYPDFALKAPQFFFTFLKENHMNIISFWKRFFIFVLEKYQKEKKITLPYSIAENRKSFEKELTEFKLSNCNERIMFYINEEYCYGRVHFLPIYMNKIKNQIVISDSVGANAFFAMSSSILPIICKVFPKCSVYLGQVKRENDHKSCCFMTLLDAMSFSDKKVIKNLDKCILNKKLKINFLAITIQFFMGLIYLLGKYLISKKEKKADLKLSISLLYKSLFHLFKMSVF